jgi:hypothetical protein
MAVSPETLPWALRLRGLQAQVQEESQRLGKRLEDSRRLIQALEAQQVSATDEAQRSKVASLLRQARDTLDRNTILQARLNRQDHLIRSALMQMQREPQNTALGWMLRRNDGVEILNRDGSPSPSDELRVGNHLRTGSGSTTLVTSDGRGHLRVGPHSELQLEPEGYLLLKGSLEHTVQTTATFTDDMKALFQRYGEDLRTLWEADEATWKEAYRRFEVELQIKANRLLKVHTLVAVCAVRGTRYEVEHQDGLTRVTVREGHVEVQHRRIGESRIVEAGQRLELTDAGWMDPSEAHKP